MSTLFFVFVALLLSVYLLAFAFCYSAALADRKLKSLHVKRAAAFSSAITKPICKRVPRDNGVEKPNVDLEPS